MPQKTQTNICHRKTQKNTELQRVKHRASESGDAPARRRLTGRGRLDSCPLAAYASLSYVDRVLDMVRISDARMSGTAYDTCVLHVAPESFAGGPLAFVRDGDVIELDVPARRLTLRVTDEELARRRASWKPARWR